MSSPLWDEGTPNAQEKNEVLVRILKLMAEGKADTEIHREIGRKTSWISRQVRRMMLNSGAKNRTQLVSRAFEEGVLTGSIPAVNLKDSQFRILQLYAQGDSLEQVSLKMYNSPHTIALWCRFLRAMLGAKNMRHAVALYHQLPNGGGAAIQRAGRELMRGEQGAEAR